MVDGGLTGSRNAALQETVAGRASESSEPPHDVTTIVGGGESGEPPLRLRGSCLRRLF
jgi:hypothetical protein